LRSGIRPPRLSTPAAFELDTPRHLPKSAAPSPEFAKECAEMAKAVNRVQVILECTSCRKSGTPGVSRYVTTKNKRNTTGRIELKKYCKHERMHTVHRETK